MITGGTAMSGSITTSRITGARAASMKSSTTGARAAMKSRTTAATEVKGLATAMAAAVTIANPIGVDTQAGIPASLTALTITTVMNTATARASLITSADVRRDTASLITSADVRGDTASLITAADTGAAPRSGASSSARGTRSSRGSATRRPSAGGARTRFARGCTRAAGRAATSDLTSASVKTSTTV